MLTVNDRGSLTVTNVINVINVTQKVVKKDPKMTNSSLYKWSKHKKLFILAPEHARTVLNAFLECMYFGQNDGRRVYFR